jgi:hypothetical protein
MDPGNCDLAKQWVSASYINQGAQALAARRKRIKALLSSRRLPEQGWDEATIEMLVQVWAGAAGRVGVAVPPCLQLLLELALQMTMCSTAMLYNFMAIVRVSIHIV